VGPEDEEAEPVVFTRNGCVTLTKKQGKRTVHSVGSNFWIAPDGVHVEGPFQAEKHEGHPWRQAILRQIGLKPAAAKALGREWILTREELLAWDRRKWYVMRGLIADKIYYEEFCVWLAATGTMKIVEFNWWHDNYWGNCECIRCHKTGNNHLGQILMNEREKLIKSDDAIYKRIRKSYGLEAVHETAVAA